MINQSGLKTTLTTDPTLPILQISLIEGIQFAFAIFQTQRINELLSILSPSISSHAFISNDHFILNEGQSHLEHLHPLTTTATSSNATPLTILNTKSVQFPFLYGFPYSYVFSLHESKSPEFESKPPWHLLYPEAFAIHHQHDKDTGPVMCQQGYQSRHLDLEIPLRSGIQSGWSFQDVDHYHQILFNQTKPSIIESVDPKMLQRWTKLQSFEFLSATLIWFLDLRIPIDQVRYIN